MSYAPKQPILSQNRRKTGVSDCHLRGSGNTSLAGKRLESGTGGQCNCVTRLRLF